MRDYRSSVDEYGLIVRKCRGANRKMLDREWSQEMLERVVDPYEVIRQAYLVGTDTESEPFEGKARTPESPHIVAPPTCHVEELEGSGTSGVKSTSSDSTTPLSLDHPLTHTTPVLVLILRRTARMAVRVPPALSPSLSAGIAELTAMSDSAFCKRFRSFYDSSPSPPLPVRKRYRGTSELILGTDSEEDDEVEESLDSDSESEGAKEKSPTIEDEDPVAGDEGLAAGVEGPGVDDESYGLDGDSYGLDDESYGLNDESYGLDDESHGVDDESRGDEEAVPEGQQQAASVVGTTMSAPLRLGYRALRRRELALELVHDMLLQQTALQQELQEMRGRVTALKQERDRRERCVKTKVYELYWKSKDVTQGNWVKTGFIIQFCQVLTFLPGGSGISPEDKLKAYLNSGAGLIVSPKTLLTVLELHHQYGALQRGDLYTMELVLHATEQELRLS
nr:hypothetical protein [Tanacetum cinerariifolium]